MITGTVFQLFERKPKSKEERNERELDENGYENEIEWLLFVEQMLSNSVTCCIYILSMYVCMYASVKGVFICNYR